MKISVFERLFNERILNKEVGLVLQKRMFKRRSVTLSNQIVALTCGFRIGRSARGT